MVVNFNGAGHRAVVFFAICCATSFYKCDVNTTELNFNAHDETVLECAKKLHRCG